MWNDRGVVANTGEGNEKWEFFIALIIERSNGNYSCYSRHSFRVCFASVLRELSEFSSAG